MSQQQELAGVLPVFQTPFNDDERIDLPTLQKEIEWLYECGADGIVMAMVSEVLRLSSEEREQLAQARSAIRQFVLAHSASEPTLTVQKPPL